MKKEEELLEAPQSPVVASFSKGQLLGSKWFEPYQKDVLCVVLEDESNYTIAQAELLLKETLERKVI